jgi:hypothetical protein
MPEAVLEGTKKKDRRLQADIFSESDKGNICFLPKHYNDYSKYIEEFQVREDDVWVVSYIKAGECRETLRFTLIKILNFSYFVSGRVAVCLHFL